jgi:cell division septum initiation protein DivIVA
VDVLHLIDRLEEMVADARRLPLGGGIVVPRQQVLDLVDQMRVALPRQVYDARDVVERRDEIMRESEHKAQERLSQADEELEKRLAQTEVVQAAQSRAEAIVMAAEERARELLRDAEQQARARLDESQTESRREMGEADAYSLQTLRRLEDQLEGFLGTVRNGIDALEARSVERPGG